MGVALLRVAGVPNDQNVPVIPLSEERQTLQTPLDPGFQIVGTFSERLLLAPSTANGFGRLAAGKGFWSADIAADFDQGNIVGPGSWLVLYDAAGVPTTPGSVDILSITTSATVGSTNAWDILILGRST